MAKSELVKRQRMKYLSSSALLRGKVTTQKPKVEVEYEFYGGN
jgi:hypothetical protein